MSSEIQAAEAFSATEGQANGYISNISKQPLKIPATSAGGPIKENQSNNIGSLQNQI